MYPQGVESHARRRGHTSDDLEPLYCYAISAKRYALFNLDSKNRPVLRKASAHGLGHWLPPYADKSAPPGFPKPVVELEGVRRWQHDLWRRIIVAALAGRETNTNPAAHAAFDKPVASQYHATTPAIWKWFDTYNESRPRSEQIRPFNFLLAFQVHPLADELDDQDDGKVSRKRRKSKPTKAMPVAPYSTDALQAAKKCFDRETGRRVPLDSLQTYREALAQYHLYPETKFLNGKHRDKGSTFRRHIRISARDIHYIGKEANELEEQIFLGFDPEAQPDYGVESEAYAELRAIVQDAVKKYALLAISLAAGISMRYLQDIRNNRANATPTALRKIESVIPELEVTLRDEQVRIEKFLERITLQSNRIGLRQLAKRLQVDHSNLAKMIAGERAIPQWLIARFEKLHREPVL